MYYNQDVDKETFNKIINLNKKFYAEISKDFSDTRSSYWKGWNNLLPYIKEIFLNRNLFVADLGCGNGRFYSFLDDNFDTDKISYI